MFVCSVLAKEIMRRVGLHFKYKLIGEVYGVIRGTVAQCYSSGLEFVGPGVRICLLCKWFSFSSVPHWLSRRGYVFWLCCLGLGHSSLPFLHHNHPYPHHHGYPHPHYPATTLPQPPKRSTAGSVGLYKHWGTSGCAATEARWVQWCRGGHG